MVELKRIIVALVFGFVAGIICYVGGLTLVPYIDPLRIVVIFVNRILIGFVIGISALKMKWYLHGLLQGFIVGLPFLLFDLYIGVELWICGMVLIFSLLFGLMIEFFTTKVFNAPVEASS